MHSVDRWFYGDGVIRDVDGVAHALYAVSGGFFGDPELRVYCPYDSGRAVVIEARVVEGHATCVRCWAAVAREG